MWIISVSSFENKLESTLSTYVASTTSLQFISYAGTLHIMETSLIISIDSRVTLLSMLLQHVDPFSASKRVPHKIM